MARHTKTKFAALAFSIVAVLGFAAAAPATSANAGHAPSLFRISTCC